MTSQEAKIELMRYFIYDRNFTSVMTEFGIYDGWADIFAVDPNFYGYEVEIKVNKADLESELKTLEHLKLDGEQQLQIWNERREKLKNPSFSKIRKHTQYLEGFSSPVYYENYAIPNKFYFAIPMDWADRALQVLTGSKYGLICFTPSGYAKVCKKAQFLHKNPLEKRALIQSLRKVSNENYQLRSKVLELKVRLERSISNN